LIQAAESKNRRKGEGIYYENHHKIPKCVGGEDTKDNMVLLTAKEHFIAHHLLSKMFYGRERHNLIYAFDMMCRVKSDLQERDYNITSTVYENIRREFSRVHSERMIGCTSWAKGKKFTDEHRKNISDSHKGLIPWMTGKNHSEESKLRMSESNLGKIPWMKGKKHTEKSKKKMSKSLKGRTAWNKGIPLSDEAKEHLRRINLGKKQSEETKLKKSIAMKGLVRGAMSDEHRRNACVSKRKDNTIYKFKNIKTEDIFIGTRYELVDKYNLKLKPLTTLCTIKRGKTSQNWLVEDYNYKSGK